MSNVNQDTKQGMIVLFNATFNNISAIW